MKNPLRSGISKARVACFSDDVQGCFRVMEQGVEGTLVELPTHVSDLSLPGGRDRLSNLYGCLSVYHSNMQELSLFRFHLVSSCFMSIATCN